MSKYTSEQYNKVFWKLPVEIRDVITSYSTTEHINIVGKKHNLHIDKIGELVDLTFDVMMGIVATKDFVKELQDALQINALEASVLARDIDENIFKPIKETMTHLYAGRAPYKPSSSLVEYYEEDEGHPALDQATLLKEIEDPTPVEVKRETTVIASKDVSVKAGEEIHAPIPNNLTPSHTNTLVEYHEELKNEERNKSFQVSGVSSGNVKQNTIPEKPPVELGIDGLEKTSRLQKIPIVQDIKDISMPPITKSEPTAAESIPSSNSNKLKGDSILSQLASIKLSQAFVMPKGPEGIAEFRKLEGDAGGKLLAVSLEKKEQTSGLASKADELKHIEEDRMKREVGGLPKTSAPVSVPSNQTPSPRLDPYREAI